MTDTVTMPRACLQHVADALDRCKAEVDEALTFPSSSPPPSWLREALEQLKKRLDYRLDEYLCKMKPNYDDSITGFNEAGDIMRALFAESLAASPDDGWVKVERIYLASRYSRFKEMQQYRDELEADGFKVTSRWINGGHQIDDAGLSVQAKEAECIRVAQEDRDDLLAADCIISFTEPPRSTNSRGGCHVEHGIALGRGKRTIVVGHRENVFHCLPEVEFYDSWVEARANLDRRPSAEQGG